MNNKIEKVVELLNLNFNLRNSGEYRKTQRIYKKLQNINVKQPELYKEAQNVYILSLLNDIDKNFDILIDCLNYFYSYDEIIDKITNNFESFILSMSNDCKYELNDILMKIKKCNKFLKNPLFFTNIQEILRDRIKKEILDGPPNSSILFRNSRKQTSNLVQAAINSHKPEIINKSKAETIYLFAKENWQLINYEDFSKALAETKNEIYIKLFLEYFTVEENTL